MSSTTLSPDTFTRTYGGQPVVHPPNELLRYYESIVEERRFHWTEHHRFTRLLGSGGQGVVFLSERRGADGFTLPVAVKIFSPERYPDVRSYDEAMARIAQIGAGRPDSARQPAGRAELRRSGPRPFDGDGMGRRLRPAPAAHQRNAATGPRRVSNRRWEYINNVIVTSGPQQPRVKPGIAISVLRECLAALGALQREGIVHGDLKPSNIMLKRTGNAKVIDIGSAFDLDDVPTRRTCTPPYAAPEILEGADSSPRADLCSLGYVLIEMLAGASPFSGLTSFRELLEAKRSLPHRLPEFLPQEVACSDLLMNLCRGLIAPDPQRRFPSAEAADLVKEGAANFQRQLVKGDLASEYENEIRLWLEELD